MVTATASGATVVEGDTSYRTLIFTVELDVVPTERVAVPWRILSGSAEKGGDTSYVSGGYTSGIVYFNAGQAPVQEVRFYPSGDFVAEADESVVLELLPPDNADLPDGALTYETVGWIQDDDSADTALALWVSNPKVVEGSTNQIEYKLQLSRPAEKNLFIDYSLEGSADGDDYRDKSGTIRFAAGETEATVIVSLKNGKIAEGLEHLDLKLDLPGDIAESHGGHATIYDDDSVPPNQPIVSIAGTDFLEGDSSYKQLTFSVSLSHPTSERVDIPWRLASGTATPGSDTQYYTGGYASGTVYINPGATQTTITVYPAGDLTPEVDENFVVELLTPVNASLPGGVNSLEAVGWVRDDDGTAKPLALHVGNIQVRETDKGEATASFVFELSRAAPRDIKIDYRTVDGTAAKGLDYDGTAGTVTILKGQRTATVGVDILPDNCFEGNETFRLRIDAPSVIAQVSGGNGVIVNDDLITDICRIDGTGKSETIRGGAQPEIIRGLGGRDKIYGDDGDDNLKGNNGNDIIEGGDGDDKLKGGADDDLLRGGNDNDRIYGDAGNDRAYGNGGRDKVWGGAGDDELGGNSGNDEIRGESGKDVIDGGDGSDFLKGGGGRDKIKGGNGNDQIYGQGGNDDLKGNGGNDRLNGGSGDDDLHGGGGRDKLKGGNGDDGLQGGSNRDVFIFDKNDDRNVISDFEDRVDRIEITSGVSRYRNLDIDRAGDGVKISWGDTKVWLEDFDIQDIGSGDFIFS